MLKAQASRRPSYSSRRHQRRISRWHFLDFSNPLGSTQGSVPGNADSFPDLVPNVLLTHGGRAEGFLPKLSHGVIFFPSASCHRDRFVYTGPDEGGGRQKTFPCELFCLLRGPTGLWGHPELGCSLAAMDALGWAERGLQGNLVCILVTLVDCQKGRRTRIGSE